LKPFLFSISPNHDKAIDHKPPLLQAYAHAVSVETKEEI
jgi:hypothetical protein